MAVQASKVFPQSSRTDRQRAQSAQDASGGITTKDYNSITNSIASINRNLLGVQKLIAADLQQDNEDALRESKISKAKADALKKKKKENFIEFVTQKALVQPVKKGAKVAKNVFKKFFEALGLVFIGWLADKGGKLWKAIQEGDQEKIQEMKNNIIGGLAVAGGVLFALNGGIGLIVTGIGALIGTIISSIPAVIGLLANPLVWMGIAAAIATTDVKSGTDKEIWDMVENAKGDRSVAIAEMKKRINELEQRKNEPGFNIKDELEVNTAIAEWNRQLRALELGYWGTGDPRFRHSGYERTNILGGHIGNVQFFNKHDRSSIWMDDDLYLDAKNATKTPENIANLIRYQGHLRDMSRIRQNQLNLKKQLENDKIQGQDREHIKELIRLEQVKFEQNYVASEKIKEGLGEDHKKVLDTLYLRILNLDGVGNRSDSEGPDNKLGTLDDVVMNPKVYEQFARILERVYPDTRPEQHMEMPIGTEGVLGKTESLEGTPPGNSKTNNFRAPNPFEVGTINGTNGSSETSVAVNQSTEKTPNFEFVPLGLEDIQTVDNNDTGEVDNSLTGVKSIATSNSQNSFVWHYSNVYNS